MHYFRKEVGLDLFFPQQLINSMKVNLSVRALSLTNTHQLDLVT